MAHSKQDEEAPFIHDVVIVGAGPCGLAVAARLREHTPSALFTDEEHHRYHWINKHATHASIKNSKTGAVRRRFDEAAAPKNTSENPSMLVLDSSGAEWMTKWKRLFAQLEISHLRSPMFFHPDPQERDGLLAFAHAAGRECECLEIVGCVGKELSKHQMKKKRKLRKAANEQAKPPVTIDERDRKDYFAPPSDLFEEYCKWIAQRYDLCGDDLIHKASVTNLDYDIVPQLSTDEKFFTLTTTESVCYARAVVLAVGAGNAPSIPAPFPQSDCPCACHAFQGLDEALPSKLGSRRTTNVLVVGGGLTSAQISDRAIKQGSTKVWHLMRGPLKVKPFDVDLSWMGKFRNHERASFWSADTDGERSELVKSARGGGSVTPRYAKVLQQHIASGRLSLHTHTVVREQRYDSQSNTWNIATEPAIEDLPAFDFIYFATGVQSNFKRLPYLRTMIEKYPIESYDGLPALTDDLMWKADVPLFMTGKFAALRLGPGAGNLEGARTGAERVAWAMPDVLGNKDEVSSPVSLGVDEATTDDLDGADQWRYKIGIGSRFQALALEA